MLSTSTKAEMIIAGRCFLKNVSAAMARTATRTIHPSPPWNRLALYPNADTNGTMQAMIASTPAT